MALFRASGATLNLRVVGSIPTRLTSLLVLQDALRLSGVRVKLDAAAGIEMEMDFDVILEALTDDDADEIRRIFRQKRRSVKDADSLLADWRRISEVAHQHALRKHTPVMYAVLLSRPDVQKRRDRQLRHAITAAKDAVRSIRLLLKLASKHTSLEHSLELKAWSRNAAKRLHQEHRLLRRVRLHALSMDTVAAPKGTPRWFAETCILEVLAAYFRHKSWPITTSRDGLFATVACVVLPGSRMDINFNRLKSMADSKLDYEALERDAPRGVEFANPRHRRSRLR